MKYLAHLQKVDTMKSLVSYGVHDQLLMNRYLDSFYCNVLLDWRRVYTTSVHSQVR